MPTSIDAKPRFFLRAVLCITAPFVLFAVFDLLNMHLTDAGGFGAKLIYIEYRAYYALTIASAYTLIVAAIYTKGPKSAAKITAVYAALRFIGEMLEHLYERWMNEDGAATEYDRIMYGVSHISEFFIAVALAFGVWIMATAFFKLYKSSDGKRKYAVRSAVNSAILLEFIVSFARMALGSGGGLILGNTAPSVDAISDVVYGAVETVVFFAIIAFIGSRIVLFVCTEKEF